jgi:photosystem II stability/assembly factor-like uncharacterized protein
MIRTAKRNQQAVNRNPMRCVAVLGIAAAMQALAQTPKLVAITHPPPAVPYVWKSVVLRAGGFVSGIVFSPTEKGLVYARTDVGGAYRSDDAGNHWVPLTDRFGRDDSTYLGIESIALDPTDPNKLYMAEGMYSADWGGPSAIFRSNDRGKTFQKTPMPFKMGGNDNGRGVGERLAVDPNLPSVLYFGSRKAGLWKSADSGVTWKHVDSFPVQARVTGVGENTGITFVVFDSSTSARGSATKAIYAGAAQAEASLYRSLDAGATWSLVPSAPRGLFPHHAVVDPGKSIYLTFADNVGPNDIHDGAVYKFNVSDGKWKDITPVRPGTAGIQKFGYTGLTMDAEHPDTLMVTTIDWWYPGDRIYRSTNGGKSWKDVVATAIYSAPNTPWVYWHKETTGGHGWMSDIKIDPFDSAKVMYTTGEGIWGSADITALDAGKPTHWGFPDDNLEETVPLALISPSQGAPLLSGVGDIGGYRHEDLDTSPKDGFFINPQFNTTSSIDFAERAPMVVVRVGYGDSKIVHAGYSLDDGVTWKPFAAEPPSSKNGGGHIAISTDGRTVVWSPNKGAPYLTVNWGKTWFACTGLTDKMHVYSDRANPNKFYSFNEQTGQLLESFDRAQNFAVRAEAVAPKGYGFRFAATPGVDGDFWIAAGDKLYHSADSGVSFVALDGMAKVTAMGFGKPAAGKTTPALYMNGIAAGEEGIFRSDDAGQSWVRIDDPAHQFGWKNAVIGDPRQYGRAYLATGGRGILYGEPAAVPASIQK